MDEPAAALVLGPDQCHDDASSLSQAQRRLLQRLALAAPHPLGLSALGEAIWEGEPPNHLRATIQNQVSRVRRRCGDAVILTVAEGYRLGVRTDAEDLLEGSAAAEKALHDGDARRAHELADRAVRLTRGEAYPDLDHLPGIEAVRRSLDAAHRSAENTRLEAALELGLHGWSLTEATRLAGAYPYDEHRQALLARALAAAGRRGDALASILSARRLLKQDLGIDAGAHLDLVEDQILHPAGRGPATIRGPFVGRLGEIRAALTAIAQHTTVELSGEPGIGVSRLLGEIASQLRSLDARVLLVSAREHQDVAAGVLRTILEELNLEPGPRGTVGGFLDAVRTAHRTDGPVTILIDDAELIGPTSRATLTAMAELPEVRLVLGTHDPAGSWGVDVLDVRPLTRDDVAALVLQQHRHLEPGELDRLLLDSGGNPAVLEVLLANPESDRDGHRRSLAGVVEQLWQTLPTAERDIVERAAVAGSGFPWSLLEPAGAPIPVLLRVDAEGGVHFRHGVLSEAIVHRMLPGRREEIHAHLGTVTGQAGGPGHLSARHWLAAGSLGGPEAVDACRRAAAESASQGAHADAAAWLAAALDLDLSSGLDQVTLRVELGDAQRMAGQPEHLDTLRSALLGAIAHDDEALISQACFALLQLGGTTTSGKPFDGLETLVDQAVAAVTTPSLRAPIHGAASLAWSLTGHAPRAREHFDRACDLARTPAARAQILPFAYMSLGMPGDLTVRDAAARELRDLGASLGDPLAEFEGWQLAFSVALQDGSGDRVRHCVRRMGELVDEVNDVGRRWAHHFALAAVAHLDGRDEDAERLADEAHDLFAPISPSRALAAQSGQLFGLRMTQGRVAELADTLAWLVDEQPGLPAWHAAYALALAVRGDDPVSAAEHAGLALDLAQEDVTWLAAHVVGARAVSVVGDGGLARRYLDRLEPWTGRSVWQGTCSYGPVDTALALLCRARADDAGEKHHAAAAQRSAEGLGGVSFLRELTRWGLDGS